MPYAIFDVWKTWQIIDTPGTRSGEKTGWVTRLTISIASHLVTMALGDWLALIPSRMQRFIKAYVDV